MTGEMSVIYDGFFKTIKNIGPDEYVFVWKKRNSRLHHLMFLAIKMALCIAAYAIATVFLKTSLQIFVVGTLASAIVGFIASAFLPDKSDFSFNARLYEFKNNIVNFGQSCDLLYILEQIRSVNEKNQEKFNTIKHFVSESISLSNAREEVNNI